MRVLDFNDGFTTSSSPTAGSVAQNSLAVYLTDAAYVAGKGSAAANGDAYYNSTEHAVRVYQNGAWHFVKTGVVLSYASDAAYVTGKGSAAANGDLYYSSTESSLKIYRGGDWHFMNVGQLVSYATQAAFLAGKRSGGVAQEGDTFYDSTYKTPMAYLDAAWRALWTPISATQNRIINGSMAIWQRNTSFAAAANNSYSADRFRYKNVASTAIHTISRSTDVPTLAESGFESSYSMLIDCTTADVAVGANDRVAIFHQMEGYDWAQLKNRTVTLSFWVKATKTGIYCVAFQNNGNDRSYVAEYTINVANTWEKKIITVTLNPTGGTDGNFRESVGLEILFTLMAGPNYHTTGNAWQTGNFLATANQVNGADSAANDFRITQIMLNVGPVAQPFAYAGGAASREYDMAERYYEKSYNLNTFAGSAAPTDHGNPCSLIDTTRIFTSTFKFRQRKRAAPTVAYYDNAGTLGIAIRQPGTTENIAAASTTSTSREDRFAINTVSAAVSAAFGGTAYHFWCEWIADAEY